MQNNFTKINFSTYLFGFLSKFFIGLIILIQIILLIGLPIFLNKQKLNPLEYKKQKTALLIHNFRKGLQKKFEHDKQAIIYPLIIEINNRINKISWQLKNEEFNVTISYLQGVKKNILSYEKSLKNIQKLLNIDFPDINKNLFLKKLLEKI